jgi:hypothetical protein
MNLRFDIFKIERDGIPCWLGAAESFENAKQRLRQWAPKESAAQFLLFDQVTGEKKIVTTDEIGLQNSPNGR